jgi:hypothetical protein
VEGLRWEGFGDLRYDGDVEEGGEAGTVVGDVFVLVCVGWVVRMGCLVEEVGGWIDF